MAKILDNIHSPEDLKRVPPKYLNKLAHEIRSFLVHSISKTGGHLSANLGVVELSIALHYVFQSPDDKIIWDVGHQAYVHKLLTGRKEGFKTLRKEGGLSGFPKVTESMHDMFNTGHSSTSISAALGMAKARDMKGEDHSVISVIGDGSLTGGMAFEALNNTGRSNTKMIVILNDNQMSISENVGGLTKYLCDIRTESSYIEAKEEIEKILKCIPGIGDNLVQSVKSAKDTLRYMLVPGVLFEELGFNYFGPVDGHDIQSLISVLRSAKKVKEPVFIHVKTVKGKGYLPAEQMPCLYHGVPTFDVKTGKLQKGNDYTYSKAFGTKMVELGKKNDKVVAITAAMPEGTGLTPFADSFPKRFFDVGIAEQHAVTFAAGLATAGMKPVVAVYSSFLQRAYDQVLHDVCLQNLPVVFALDRAGIVGADGETHQGIYDLSYLSHMPNMTVMAPKNHIELNQMLEYAINYNGPIAIRYPKGTVSTVNEQCQQPIERGKSEVIKEGKTIAVIAYGSMNDVANEVILQLESKGYEPSLINGRFIAPFDETMVLHLSKNHDYIFTIEENVIDGGFGSKYLNCLMEKNIYPKHFKAFGLPKTIIEQGNREHTLKKFGLDRDSIVDYIVRALETKGE